MAFYVYILRCSDGSYYVGHTDNLENRFAAHQAGSVPGCYTHDVRPVTLMYSQEFGSRDEAFQPERQIKGWSRAKKEAMINGNIRRLKVLSQNYTEVEGLRQAQPVRRPPSAGSG